MGINTMITTYNTAVTDAADEILGNESRRKMPWVTRLFSTSLMRGDETVCSGRSKTIQGSKQEDPEVSEESKRGLDRYPVRRDRSLPEQKQQ